jgi:uncharacterized protein (DUF1810 family)
MEDTLNLERFGKAQEQDYEQALAEVRNGHKYSHWIWYIFPQLDGLGHSHYSHFYGISGAEEAKAYLENPILSKHLREITQAFLDLKDASAYQVFGGIDSKKVLSSMTLFDFVSPNDIFQQVIDRYYQGKKDRRTTEKLL